MIKQINVTFEFDTETEEVSKMKCSIDGVEKKKTRKKSEVIEEMADTALLTLEEKKLVFNNKAIADMNISAGDRVDIVWEAKDKKSKTMVPKIIVSDEDGTGNKLTKAGTIAYKGKQNAVLAEFGSEFTVELRKDGAWNLIPTSGSITTTTSSLEESIESAEEINADLITDDEDELELDNIAFTLNV